MRRRKPNFTKLVFDTAKLGVTAGMVMGLRVAKIAIGGPGAKTESKRMVAEKMKAAAEVGLSAATDALTGRAHRSPSRTLALYQKRVSRNLRRLSTKK
jgi:hypothetical protein